MTCGDVALDAAATRRTCSLPSSHSGTHYDTVAGYRWAPLAEVLGAMRRRWWRTHILERGEDLRWVATARNTRQVHHRIISAPTAALLDEAILRARQGREPVSPMGGPNPRLAQLLNPEPEARTLLTPAEVAALFGVNDKTVMRWANTGKLASVRTPGGQRRYFEPEVRALLNR
ncbi:BldC family transcriptional regulator [Nocardiopsis dassonvillei]|uniref:BldC family transcriptional regulator n=1 Tax=Nocardiopsis dassonvillei TaxID=2014 RepID=UPI003644D087